MTTGSEDEHLSLILSMAGASSRRCGDLRNGVCGRHPGSKTAEAHVDALTVVPPKETLVGPLRRKGDAKESGLDDLAV